MNHSDPKLTHLTRNVVGTWLRTILILAIVGMSLQHPFESPSIARAYSSGTATTQHCYAFQYWYGGTKGLFVSFLGVHLNCSTCGSNNFVDNEAWLNDYYTPNCVANGYGVCWVEAGYISLANYNSGTPSYFYAYVRPPNTFNRFFLSALAPGDFGNSIGLSVYERDSSSYNVHIVSPTGYNQTFTVTTSAHNTQLIEEGQELQGTSGGSAPQATFLYSEWLDSQGYYHYQDGSNSNSGFIQYNPPYGNYIPTSYGGIGDTYCC